MPSPMATGACILECSGGSRPAAFIDWDAAAPGPRLKDIGYMCWQYLVPGPMRPGTECLGRLIRLVCDGYELSDRTGLVEAMLQAQNECVRGTIAAAAAGDEACQRLVEDGTVDADLADVRWTAAHRAALESALR